MLTLFFLKNSIAQEVYTFCFERWKPYSFNNQQGKAVGESITLVKRATDFLGVKAEFKELPFARCLASVTSGKIMFAMHTDETESLPYIDTPISDWQLALAVTSDSHVSDLSLKMFKSLKVLVARSYQYPDKVDEFLTHINAKVKKANYYTQSDEDTRKLFNHLIYGRVEAMIVDRVWASKMKDELNLPIKLLTQDLYVQPQYIGYQNGQAKRALKLKSALDMVIKKTVELD